MGGDSLLGGERIPRPKGGAGYPRKAASGGTRRSILEVNKLQTRRKKVGLKGGEKRRTNHSGAAFPAFWINP